MSVGLRALLLGLVLAPAVALCLLGIRSLGGEEARARHDAAAKARRIRERLQADLADALEEARGRLEAGERPTGAFRIDASGRIVDPPVRSFPARARSFPSGDLVALRSLLQTVDREILGGGDPEAAVRLLESAADVFENEDLAAVVRDRTALAMEKAGRPEDALRLWRENIADHAGARDLEGFPVAITGGLRAVAAQRALGPPEAAEALAREFAALLAENPWGLPEEQRALVRRDLPRVPEQVILGALRGIVLPEIAGGTPEPGWRTLRGRAAGVAVLVTDRSTASGTEGIVIPERELGERLAARARALEEVTGAAIRLHGEPAPEGTETVAGPLDAPFSGFDVLVAVRPDERGGTLRALWIGLSALLLLGLASGVVLGLRALGREIRLARLRQEFLDNVSHELRTPLASIRTLAENLEDDAVPEDRRADYFRALHRESRRVARLVEDVLDLSRLDRGVATIRRDQVDPVRLARAAVSDLAAESGAADFEVTILVEGEPPTVRGDEASLRRALLNLLVNAARYSREERTAELTVRAADGRVRLEVRDRGPGVPAADRGAIFDRFHRVSSETHEVKGAGLGLPLARAVVEAHGGRLRLRSEVGRGSTFIIDLPAETTT